MSAMSDAEKIRAKRLAKLGGTPSQSPQPSTAPAESVSVPKPKPKPITVQRTPTTDTPKLAPAKPKPVVQQSYEDWAEATLSSILKPDAAQKDITLTYLSGLRQELEEEGAVPRLDVNCIERVLYAYPSQNSTVSPFTYFLSSWRRAQAIVRTSRFMSAATQTDGEPKAQLLVETKRLLVSFAGFALYMPDMFESSSAPPASLLDRLLVSDPSSDNAVPYEFLTELAANPDGLEEVMGPVVEGICGRLSGMTIADGYQPYLNAFTTLVSLKPVAALIPTLPTWNPENLTAANVESLSIFGPLFRLSPLHLKIAASYFPNVPQNKYNMAPDNMMSVVRMTSNTLQTQLFNITNAVVRASPTAREAVLNWFARVINLNHKRRAMQVDPATIATDGFMLNVTAVLNKFCEPFMDLTHSKIDKIDVAYFRREPRLQIAEETKLSADEREAATFYGNKADGVTNFISEVFFLNVAAHHYGLGLALQERESLIKEIEDWKKKLERGRMEEPRFANTPQAPLYRATLDKLAKRIDESLCLKYAYDSLLLDKVSMTQSLLFMNLVATWLLRLVDPKRQHPQQPLHLPLPPSAPDAFRNLPEYMVEDVAEFFLHLSRNDPRIVASNPSAEIVIFAITFVRTSAYIQNPHLKAKLIEILYFGTYKQPGMPKGCLGDMLNGDAFALEHLLPAMMTFYIECEQTGASSQFYDKFNIRYHISQVFKAVWENPAYRDRLSRERSNNLDFFIRFVALLINDATYLLDEGLSKLTEINKLQNELDAEQVDPAAPPTRERQELEGNLRSAERSAGSYVSLANETVAMLRLFTDTIPDAFCTNEIVDRFAAMLDYNVDALVGPRCTTLKVKEPQKYRFAPRDLLSAIIDIYLNLQDKSEFILAVARDGRSYKKELFERAASILTKYTMKNPKDIDALMKLVERIEKAKLEDLAEEEELGEIPDEFLDPLTYELMEDPVILPVSKATIDLSSIKAHLLNDPKDPFNRSPLKIEDVIPATELKAKIQAFKAERRAARLAGAGEPMDTSA
ncbi:Ubiquitin conjugation factor E4 [Saitoella coloradoensis]